MASPLNGHEFEHIWEVVKDSEAWYAAVRGFAKSQTRLSDWTPILQCLSLGHMVQLSKQGTQFALISHSFDHRGLLFPPSTRHSEGADITKGQGSRDASLRNGVFVITGRKPLLSSSFVNCDCWKRD